MNAVFVAAAPSVRTGLARIRTRGGCSYRRQQTFLTLLVVSRIQRYTFDPPAVRPVQGNGDAIQAGDFQIVGLVTGNHGEDRKSTRLNSSHVRISYAVFC